MAAMVEVVCDCCGDKFQARVADRKRGWARFCSKSCKAKKAEQQTGRYAAYRERQDRLASWTPKAPDPDDDPSWDAHKH